MSILLTVLTTLGLAVITGAIKCATEETLGQAALAGLDTIFGGVLGNVCHERFNQIKDNFDPTTTSEQNADVERCSRHALLQALIAFSNAAKSQIQQTTLTAQQKNTCLHFLDVAKNNFSEQLLRLAKLSDTDPVFQRNLLTQPEMLVQILATGQEQERLSRIKEELTGFALSEFGYPPENILHQQLVNWLPQGLPTGQHWFVYYVHAFYGNLKEDKPAYCQRARRILKHNQLANLDLLAKRSLKRIDDLMIFTREIREVLADIKVQLNRIETWSVRLESQVSKVVAILKNGRGRAIPHQLTAIPALSGECIGREDDMKRLEQSLRTSRRVVLMNGIGGVGKTTMAKWFVHDHLTQYKHVCWIDVTKQDVTVNEKLVSGSLKEAVAEHTTLFRNLNLAYNPKDDSVDQRFDSITNALRNLEGPNLLVIDNAGADAGERLIRDQLPKPPHWQVLITSRQSLFGYELLQLDSLNSDAAEKLFYTYYTYDCPAIEVKALLDAIGYHTLTVELFAKTLDAHQGMLSVGELLQKVRQKELSDPALKRRLETAHHPNETEVYVHLMLAFDCTELTTDERSLLGQLALLPPEPYTLKKQLAPWLGYTSSSQLSALPQTLNQLVKKGWLNQNKHAYSLHRLIQQVVTYQIAFDWETAKPLAKAMTDLLKTVDNPNLGKVYSQLKYGEFLLAAIPVSHQNESETIYIKNNVALAYKDLGRYQEAARLLEQVLAGNMFHFSDDHPTVAVGRNNLGLIYRNLGRHQEAALLLQQALATLRAHFGDDHPQVATACSNLGVIYQDLGRYQDAVFLLDQTLASSLVHLGDDHPTVTAIRNNLAMVYRDLGRKEDAALLLEQVLVSDRAHFDDDHPTVANTRANLAMVYRDLGRKEDAALQLEQALGSDKAHFGDNHPTVAVIRNNLATVYRDLGRYQDAATLLEQVLASDRAHFDDDHPTVAITRANLATVYQDLDRYQDAALLLEQALVSDRARFGDDHPIVAKGLCTLASVMVLSNRPIEALSLLLQAESILRKGLGEQDPISIQVRSALKDVTDLMGQ